MSIKEALMSGVAPRPLANASTAVKKKNLTPEELAGRVALRPLEFAQAVGLCRATVYKLMDAGKIKSVKNYVGRHGARLITITPQEFLASLAEPEL